ncbi:WD repeat-containing protein on Y chromosome [Kryptolebias marmoratus]|uniref:WD repeat-containing protein on Y chromosome n=1 Tax=Kryptolebias marmoratus TaxID=37003 RepID=UPI0018AD0AAF|nr:WD repeat-containing protein on Y chromosome [Kryptolebias marmoratus]
MNLKYELLFDLNVKSCSITSELRDTGQRSKDTHGPGGRAVKTEDFSVRRPPGVGEDREEQPDWLLRELLKQSKRRHSVTHGEKAHSDLRGHSSQNLEDSDFMNCLINDKISLDDLQKIKLAFEESEMCGMRGIDVKNFGHILKRCLGLPNMINAQIHGLFKKIDYSAQGRISWGEFSTYVLQQYKMKEETVRRSKQVTFDLPATINNYGQGIPVVNIHSTNDDTLVTIQEDGFICLWHPELEPKETKHMFNEEPANQRSKRVSDFALMSEYNKLVIGTGDREIQIYDLFALEPYCQINGLETFPLTLDYSYTGSDKCCVLYGDVEGCVNIILMSSVEDTLRIWSKLPKLENIPNITAETAVLSPNVTFIRWKVHQDWVTQAKYFHSLQAVVSSSNEESSSLVVGCVLPLTDSEKQLNEIREVCCEGKTRKIQLSWTPQVCASCDQTVFSVHKGVKTFDLCQKHNLLVTGGMDRLVRLWNPYFSGKPTGILKGHSAPIFSLCVSSEDSQIFSLSVDATVKIWDIEVQSCLFTADPRASRIHGYVSACSYNSALKCLYVAADRMAVLTLKSRPRLNRHVHVSFNEPVMCCGYSEEFHQVVSCSEASVVKVWDLNTGRQVSEFVDTDDLTSITCMAFDPKGRRLVTGGRNGCLKIWNFNSGQCLKTLKKEGKCQEVCDCTFLKVQRNSCVVAVGKDRKIDIYSDALDDGHHVQRLQPPLKDDLSNGHQEDILCVVHCPPSLLATGSYDGEIIAWDLVSGHIKCRFAGPHEAEDQNTEGLDTSVPSIIFPKNFKLQQFSSNTTLLSSGVKGSINLWNVLSEEKLVSSFKISKFQQKITKLAQTDKDTLLYAADRIGYVYIYDMEKFDLKQRSPRAEHSWRAHTSTITSLQIVDSDQVVLTSSTDQTVRLWSAQGQCIGTFGQPELWSVHIPSSWIHPRVPYDVLIDPLSMPDHEFLNGKSHLSEGIESDMSEADGGELKTLG